MNKLGRVKHNLLEKRYIHFLIGALLSIFLILPQINTHSLVIGIDDMFFFNRYYDIMMQFKTGNFNYFMSNYGFFQSGRVVNAVYGPLFGYFQGIILLLTHTWFKFEVATSVMLLFTGFCSMKIALARLGTSENFSTVLAIMFMTVGEMEGFVKSHAPINFAFAFLPLVLVSGFLFFKKQQSLIKEILFLTFSMILVAQTHMLSTFFSVIALICFFVIAFFTTDNRAFLLKKVGFSAILTIFACGNVFYGLFLIMKKNTVIMPYESNLMRGATLDLGTNLSTFLLLSFISLALVFILVHWREIEIGTRVGTGIAVLFLLMTTSIIPWNLIQRYLPFFANIQFSVRFLSISIILLFLALGSTISQISEGAFISKKVIRVGLMLLLVPLLINQVQDYTNVMKAWADNDRVFWNTAQETTPDLKDNPWKIRATFGGRDENMGIALQKVWKSLADYLPTNDKGLWYGQNQFIVPADATPLYTAPRYYEGDYILNKTNFKKSVRGSELIVSWISKKDDKVTVPVAVYKQTKITLNGKVIKHASITKSGALVADQKKGLNNVTAEFIVPELFRIVLITSIVLCLLLFTWFALFELLKLPIKNLGLK